MCSRVTSSFTVQELKEEMTLTIEGNISLTSVVSQLWLHIYAQHVRVNIQYRVSCSANDAASWARYNITDAGGRGNGTAVIGAGSVAPSIPGALSGTTGVPANGAHGPGTAATAAHDHAVSSSS